MNVVAVEPVADSRPRRRTLAQQIRVVLVVSGIVAALAAIAVPLAA